MASVAGREISVRELNETQMMLLMREGQILRSEKADNDRRLKAIVTVLDVVESSIQDADDLEFVMGLVAKGQVGFAELLRLVAPTMDEAPPAPVRRATRKR
jgi:hypothetical protein